MINYKLRIENILKRDLHYSDVHNKAVKDFLALMKLYADEAIDNKKEICCSCGEKEKEKIQEIVKNATEEVWYKRRSLNPVKEQTKLITEKLFKAMNQQQKKEVCTSCGVKEVITNECCNVCGAMQI